MKKSFVITILLLISISLKAQSNRWKFLAKTGVNENLFIDTLQEDIKKTSLYDEHYSVVIVWTKISKTIHGKNGKYKYDYLSRMAIDTALKQFETKLIVEYKDGQQVKSTKYDEIDWRDALPDTIIEDIVRFIKKQIE